MTKIAIQGHSTRGEEVIQILESLGGKNKHKFFGDSWVYYYFIDKRKNINWFSKWSIPDNYKVYTIEEFKKEFPFKIGDKVIYDYDPYIGTVVDIKLDDNIPYRVNINGTICTCTTKLLNFYNPMNTRNITLTLDKAKEWYNKGGELREIALQAFTKEELNPLPKSWEEYCKLYKVPSLIIGPLISRKYAALWKLEQLRDCYRQGWTPDWTNVIAVKYCIIKSADTLLISSRTALTAFLTFQSKEVAEEFLQNFEPLIKEAGDLI